MHLSSGKTRTKRGRTLSNKLNKTAGELISVGKREELLSALSRLDRQGKSFLFSCLVKELHKMGQTSPVIIEDPDNAEEVLGYFMSYAVRHGLKDPLSTSKNHNTQSTDLSKANLVPADDHSWLREVDGLELP